MKVLMAGQGSGENSQLGFQEAFRRATADENGNHFRYIPYFSYIQQHGWNAFYEEVKRINEEFEPDIVFFEFFHGGFFKGRDEELPSRCIAALRAAKNKPLVFGSMGDLPYTEWYNFLAPGIAKATYDLARVADAFFVTSMGTLSSALVKRGARNVIFMPHAYSNTHYPDWNVPMPETYKHDVTMVGTVPRIMTVRPYPSMFKRIFRRKKIARLLTNRYGDRFGLYGSRWKGYASNRGPALYSELLHLFQNSLIGIDSPAPFDQMYYASDRPFFIAGSGAALVFCYMPRFEKIFKPDVHAYYLHNIKDVCSVCDKILALPRDVLAARRKETMELVQARHTLDNRIDTIISTAEALAGCRSGKYSKEEALRHLRLWHFLPDVDLEEERKHAIANWQG